MVYYVYNHSADEEPLEGVEGKKEKNFYPMMHYCVHCNTDIIGVWEFWGSSIYYSDRSSSSSKQNGEYIKIDPFRICFLTGHAIDSDLLCKQIATYEPSDFVKERRGHVPKFSSYEYEQFKSTLGHYDHILSYRKEAMDFIAMDTCPVCGEKFEEDKKYHFSRCDTLRKKCSGYSFESYIKIPDGDSYLLDAHFRSADDYFHSAKFYTDGNPSLMFCHLKYNSDLENFRSFVADAVESYLEFFRSLRQGAFEDASALKHKNYIDQCDAAMPAVVGKVELCNRGDTLKTYLGHLIDLEKNIYSVSARLKALYLLEVKVEKDALASGRIMIASKKDASEKLLTAYENLRKEDPSSEIKLEDFAVTYPEKPKMPIEPFAPVLAKPGLFNKKRVLSENAELTKKYEEAVSAYNEALLQYQAKFEVYNQTVEALKKQQNDQYQAEVGRIKKVHEAECKKLKDSYDRAIEEYNRLEQTADLIVTPEKAKLTLIKPEIKQAEEMLAKLYAARNELYAYGVIFEKYRSIVALSTFYEYLMSGRCDTLEGHEGAYNLYENEIRMNMIVSQLSEVVESLEKIKQNQYMIYNAINETNQQLSILNSSMCKAVDALHIIQTNTTDMKSHMAEIAVNTKVIAYNTEVSAYYSKKNAELTNALGFMVALG